MSKTVTYKEAGVDISQGNAVKDRIKKMVRQTYDKNVLSEIGLFGGFYELRKKDYKQPVLVSSADGVGTKLKIAIMMQKHHTVGEDLVNHCVNDILACGAKPLFFLDYIGLGKVSDTVIMQIVEGLTRGCKKNGCALIGGETAQMPGFYADGEYDMSGTIVGVAEKKKMINGASIRKGDVMIGMYSSGLHTNGYSLARKVLLNTFKVDSHIDELGCTVGEELMKVHKSYLKPVSALMDKIEIKGISHITGGGIFENTMRVVPKKLKMTLDWDSWNVLPVFELIHRLGNVPYSDMIRTFNLGVGMILVVDKKDVDKTQRILKNKKEESFVIGEIVAE
ncbi:phosphoribosylformylglycinamidine cyclo-ligase [bacterium]|nr:MAG: phosphoribosylformylglycinamidine cyclo-ligase [bacterium]